MEIFDDAIIGLTEDFKISFWSKGNEKKLAIKKK